MFWILVFLGIAVAGLLMVIGYGIWLAHKAADVMFEANRLGEQWAEIGELAGSIADATEVLVQDS